jgi:uncharacterized membrane protein
MTSYLIAAAIFNIIIGGTFIVLGIKKKGKKKFFKEMGYAYIAWVIISTTTMIYGATN